MTRDPCCYTVSKHLICLQGDRPPLGDPPTFVGCPCVVASVYPPEELKQLVMGLGEEYLECPAKGDTTGGYHCGVV